MLGFAISLLGCIALGLTAFLLLATFGAPQWAWATVLLILTAGWQAGLANGQVAMAMPGPLGWLVWILVLSFGVISIPALRRAVLIAPLFRSLRRRLSRVSETARQTLAGGTVGFERELFTGRPNWEALRAVPTTTLTDEERAFLDGPTEELCRVTDDWRIRHEQEIPETIWALLKAKGFFGLRISRTYGGLGFSAQALSLIFGKIASRSPDIFGVTMALNSLGLGELIETHGTEKQKIELLPRLANGREISCLAITGTASGSDAATMRDVGIAARGSHDDRPDTIGVRLSWDKRYITLAPDATLIGLAFRLFDPENLLGRGYDVGITLALVPADHPGVNIGRRHLASGSALPNGPTSGRDVFIPLTWVLGGEAGLGQGWRILMDQMSASRAIALPASAAAACKSVLRFSTAYGRIRRQFGVPIGRMEGLEEPLSRMAETAYVNEAGRAATAAMVDRGEKPAVISALMKYQSTERLRRAVNDAMDLHAGRAVSDGPANYLQSAYGMLPIACTVEGANIVTRALITFTQSAFRSHPHFGRELEACQDEDGERGLAVFEKIVLSHVSSFLCNAGGALLHNLSGGRFAGVPKHAEDLAVWHRQFRRASCNFAFMADLAIVLLGGGGLRRRQKITGRLADALSELYLLACILKRYEDDGRPRSDRVMVAFAAQNGLYRFQEALRGTIDNFPGTWGRRAMRLIVFPLGARCRPASDRLGHDIVSLALIPSETRDRWTRDIFQSRDAGDPTGLLELTFEKAWAAEEAEKKLERAARRGLIRRHLASDFIGEALQKGVVTEGEADLLREIDVLTARVIAVDDFDRDEVKPHYMTAGHNMRAVQGAGTA